MSYIDIQGEEYPYEEYVVIVVNNNGEDCQLLYQADALTLGMAMQMISKAFVDAMDDLPDEERNEIAKVLSGTMDIIGGEIREQH